MHLNRLEFDRKFPGPVLGLDEVGTGAIAGPITVCGLVLPGDPEVEELLYKAGARDSKQLSPSRREAIAELVHDHYVWHYIVQVEAVDYKKGWMARHLDDLFRQVLNEALARGPAVKTIIIDGDQDRDLRGYHFRAIPKADDKSLTVACASIMAKVHRDRQMAALEGDHPGYGFAQHNGYCTKQHKEALLRLGTVDGVHRDNKVTRRVSASRSALPEAERDGAWTSRLRRRESSVADARRFRPGSGRFR